MVIPNLILNGQPSEAIIGGATRDRNLFHSFQQFNVSAGRGAYFVTFDPAIANIIARVTGGSRSDILGTLGTGSNQPVNLFFINPNGILFGPQSSLDVSGSFLATTASAIAFPDGSRFSAADPASSSLLTVDPSALFFNAASAQGIVNQSVVTATPAGVPTVGLSVNPGRSLILAGGNVTLDGGRLYAPGGQLELIGLTQPGQLSLTFDGLNPRLAVPADAPLADIRLQNGAIADISGFVGGGSLNIWGDRVTLENRSSIFSNVLPGQTTNSGSINIRAGELTAQNGGKINTQAFGAGRAGDVTVIADVVEIGEPTTDGVVESSLGSQVFPGATGRSGNVRVETGRLRLRDGGFIGSSTFGPGDGGNLAIAIRDSAEITGFRLAPGNQIFASSIVSTLEATGGNAGNIRIDAPQADLVLRDGGQIQTSTFSPRNAGNIVITARSVEVDGLSANQALRSGIGSESVVRVFGAPRTGNAGNIRLSARRLSLRGGAVISASTFGDGQGGRLNVVVQDLTQLNGSRLVNGQRISSGLFTVTGGSGAAGTLSLRTNRLVMDNRANISASTVGSGNAGAISVRAIDSIDLSRGASILSAIAPGSTGDAGRIQVQADSLSLLNGAQINASVARRFGNVPGGRGRGGSIDVGANIIDIAGFNQDGFSSGILALSERGARGRAGNITVRADQMRIAEGGIVIASIFNNGRGAQARGGDIEITADILDLLTGGQVVTETRSDRPAGSIQLNIADQITIAGREPNRSQRRAAVQQYLQQPNITDRPSDVIVNVGRRSGVFASTRGRSNRGAGGALEISTTNLDLRDRGQISASSAGLGPAGSIRVETQNRLQIRDGDITTQAPRSSGGDIAINLGDSQHSSAGDRAATSLTILSGDSDITTNSLGNGGNITIGGTGVIALDDSDIISRSEDDRGGNITLPPFFSETNPPGNANHFDGNEQVDLNASGQTASGNITTPDTSSIQNSLTPLTDASVNEDQLLASSCVVRSRQPGRFIVTGAGGLPQRPGDASLFPYPTGEVRSLPETAPEAAPQSRSWRPGDPVIEPQGVYQLTDGRLVLSRECNS
ncbi:MAG: hypothetical protein Fur0046_22610 [Cyanobacteria bacterium J069]